MTDLPLAGQRWADWPDWEIRLVQPADLRGVAIAAAGGVAFDLGVRSGVASLGGCVAVGVAAAGMHASGRVHTRASRLCLIAAAVIGPFLMLRMSPWLVPLNVLAVGGLLVLAGMLARDGRLADLSIALLGSRAVLALVHGLRAAGFLVEPVRRWIVRGGTTVRRQTAARVARGALIAAPVVLVLAALLASADAVFASVLRVDVALPGNAFAHAALVVIGAIGLGGLLRLASAAPSGPLPSAPWRVGTTEWTICLGSVVALFTAFAGVQVVAAAGGGRHVLETEGLTFAEYARSGYFQLLAVAALTGLVIGLSSALASRSTPRERRRFVVLAELTVALTLLVLVVALRRLGLYEDAYGWTMLRLFAKAGAIWIGLVLLLLAARLAGVVRERAWFTPAAIGAGLAILLVLNIANPEAAVVRHNLARAAAGHEADPTYLTGLSADAVPALLARVGGLPADERATVMREACDHVGEDSDGLLGWNLATSRARGAIASRCP